MLTRLVHQALRVPGVTAPFARLMRGRATIFVAHRFEDPEGGVEGNDPRVLDEFLAFLRSEGYEILPLRRLIERLAGVGPPPHRSVAFTIDDGYREQATVAAPVFVRHECPVTIFVTTGFLDGELWFWWDQLEYIFLRTGRPSLTVRLGGREHRYTWSDRADRRAAARHFAQRCKEVAEAEKQAAIADVAEAAGVELPTEPPRAYAPMSWKQLRSCEERGVSFAPHTVTHPVMSRVSDERSRHEITRSWDRLREEADTPVPVFAYPNGRLADFGDREIQILRRSALEAAVAGDIGHATVQEVASADGRFRIPRRAYPDDLGRSIRRVSGVERARWLLGGS